MRKLSFLFAITAFVVLAGRAAWFDSVINDYRGVFVGTDREQVHQKLGKPKDESPGEDDYEFSENESVRVFYDGAKKVKAMVIAYTGKIDAAPKPNDVIGEPIEPRPDGGMYKMVRFEQKGFWVSYVKTTGDNPSVMITVQSLKSS